MNISAGCIGHAINRGIDPSGGEFNIANGQVFRIPEIDRLDGIFEIKSRLAWPDVMTVRYVGRGMTKEVLGKPPVGFVVFQNLFKAENPTPTDEGMA
ncbi:MAG: hypothetical protein ACJZ8O_00130 [Pirellulaceae bacterium]